MASPKSFPLVRGRTMRVTRLDGCGRPMAGPDGMVVTEGFVSVALTANVTQPEEITVQNANGQTCVRDPGCAEFNGYGVEITFCDVNPCLFAMVTGQPQVLNAAGDVVGFRMNSDVRVCDVGFALEVWSGVPGVACSGEGGAYGYLLLPFVSGGVIGDFSIENAAVTFSITGSNTKDGNGWGAGPFEVVLDDTESPSYIPEPLDVNDHLYAVYTELAPPEPTDGCVDLNLPGAPNITSAELVGDELTIEWTAAPLAPCSSADVVVDWGDGSTPDTVVPPTVTATHTYADPGTYTVTITPDSPGCVPDATEVTVAV